jgi:SMP-30/Gluconolactonase/LRE-like region
VLLIGPSCTGMDHQGRVVWCADNDRQVMRLEKDGSHTVLSGGMAGGRFSGPNDIAIAADDTVYVTDNDFGLRDGGKNPDKQLQNGIYRIKDSQTTLVLSGSDLGGTPNGIALSPDGKWMYLSTANRQMRRYAVNPDGTLGAFTVFTEAPASVTARRQTEPAMCSLPAERAPASSASRRLRESCSARSTCQSMAVSPRDRSVRPTLHSAARMAGLCSWLDAIPSTRSS